jgi:hypothetical protein
MLAAGAYYQDDSAGDIEIRQRLDQLYGRVNWPWTLNGGITLSHGWKLEVGFLPDPWQGYDEALLLYVLGLGSPSYPLPESSYQAWTESFRWEILYDVPFLFAAPLFIHHFSHIWIDFRDIQDRYMKAHASDYFKIAGGPLISLGSTRSRIRINLSVMEKMPGELQPAKDPYEDQNP